MRLLNEYVITPNVCSNEINCDDSKHNFNRLKEILFDNGIVRDLQDGRWFQHFSEFPGKWNADRVKILIKLKAQNRLRVFPSYYQNGLENDLDWCREALATHKKEELEGIISTKQTCSNLMKKKKIDVLFAIENLHCSDWMRSTSCSIELKTEAQDYIDALRLTLQCSNSIMFIDPYLNPMRTEYDVFEQLFEEIGNSSKKPAIEIHTSAKAEAVINDQEYTGDLGKNFCDKWRTLAKKNRLVIEVYKWPAFHDRFLITDLIGLSLPFGFQTTPNQAYKTIWTRLQRKHRDSVQSRFSVTNRPQPITIG